VSTAIVLLIALIVPIIISELAYFIESFPQYLRRLQSLTTDPTRPWLSKLVGEGSARPSVRSVSLRRSRAAGSAHSCARSGREDEPCSRSSRWRS
jgi:predicted PurR-regulated permease PerM